MNSAIKKLFAIKTERHSTWIFFLSYQQKRHDNMLLLISLFSHNPICWELREISEKIKRSSFGKHSLLGAEEAKVTKISHEKHVLGKKTKNRNLVKIKKITRKMIRSAKQK
jgi:hypothetical protein